MPLDVRQIEDSLRQLFPADFCDRAVYLLDAHELPPERFTGCDWWGYFCSTSDLDFRDVLESTGRWRGRGPCIVLRVPTEYSDHNRYIDGTAERMGLIYALHEISHAFCQPPATLFDEPTTRMASLVELYAIAEMPQGPTTTDLEPLVPWHHHDHRFMRAAAHASYRSFHRLGFHDGVSLASIADPERYGLGDASHYVDVMAAEVEAAADDSIFDVMQTEPPAALVDLFNSDCLRWQSRQRKGA